MDNKVKSECVFWTSSAGIAANRQLPKFFTDQAKSARFKLFPKAPLPIIDDCDNSNVVVGWGNKPNTHRAIDMAKLNKLPFWRLEDGFIAYLNHSSMDRRRLSIICDKLGVYYDATRPSELELIINTVDEWFTPELHARSERVIERIRDLGVSKYNLVRSEVPDWLTSLAEKDSLILLVDQTAGDASVKGAMASQDSFDDMLADALASNPFSQIIIKTHTDVVLGKKKGYFSSAVFSHPRIHLLTEDVSLKSLFHFVTRVYTVSSQVGFEALIHQKQVHCYGMPFYAGWGLTKDKLSVDRRMVRLSLEQLVAAALIRYPLYLHPDSEQSCEVEEILEWLVLQGVGQFNSRETEVDTCYAVNFSLWKRSFIPEFIGRRARKVEFVSSLAKARSKASDKDAILLWGCGAADQLKAQSPLSKIWFMEDGFVRSVGLGADLRRPNSLVIDEQGMYYDPSVSSSLVGILNKQVLTNGEHLRASDLANKLLDLKISKYNVGSGNSNELSKKIDAIRSEGREIILVPGQYEADLSVRCSLGSVKTNLDLLKSAKQKFPKAFVIFKEHPDLYSGVRDGALGEKSALQYADVYATDIDIAELLELVDRVCTLTSLTGFEALLRQKKVSVFGSPFYAGWGLTDDSCEFHDRHRQLTLTELIDGVLIKYARYINWDTRKFTTPEYVIEQLSQQKQEQKTLKSSWFARQIRKVEYFWHAYRKAS